MSRDIVHGLGLAVEGEFADEVSVGVDDADVEGADEVGRQHGQGADFIKITAMDRDVFHAG